jgi:serine/threonine protein kinase
VKERVAAVWRAVPAPLRELQAGTPPWAAPELSLSPPGVTTASDVYSLGVLWRWMRTLGDGSAPLTAAHTALLDAMLADAPDARPTAHDALALLIAN